MVKLQVIKHLLRCRHLRKQKNLEAACSSIQRQLAERIKTLSLRVYSHPETFLDSKDRHLFFYIELILLQFNFF